MDIALDDKHKDQKGAREYIDNVIFGISGGRLRIKDFEGGFGGKKKMGDAIGRSRKRDDEDRGDADSDLYSDDSPMELAWAILKLG